MIIKNLTPNQLGSVETLLTTMQDSNPTLTWDNFPMESKPHPIHHVSVGDTEGVRLQLARLEEKVDALQALIKHIFGNHVLINNRWVFTNNIKPKE